jgi:hypothetical protein
MMEAQLEYTLESEEDMALSPEIYIGESASPAKAGGLAVNYGCLRTICNSWCEEGSLACRCPCNPIVGYIIEQGITCPPLIACAEPLSACCPCFLSLKVLSCEF